MNRLPLIGGVAFAVLSLAALLLVPLPPGVDQPGSALIDHFSAHSGLIRLQALLTALSLLALVVVLGFARDRLHGPAGYIFTIGAAVLLVEIQPRRLLASLRDRAVGVGLHGQRGTPDHEGGSPLPKSTVDRDIAWPVFICYV